MNIEHVNFILGLWAAVVATCLAVIRIMEYRYQVGHNVKAFASFECATGCVSIDVTNIGRKPTTIATALVRYGKNPRIAVLVHVVSDGLPVKLGEGDQWKASVNRDLFISGAARHGVMQARYSKLWVTIETTTRRQTNCCVRVDSSIIANPYYAPAREFIAADVLLGFPQLESDIHEPAPFHKA